MHFSYYFDVKKTHLLNCRFRILQFTEKLGGHIEIMFSAEIAEVLNGIEKKKESTIATFNFPPTEEGQIKHDIDFNCVRYGSDKKWIFTVINNKNTTQRTTIGLISTTINKNPLGKDVYHNDDEFNVELKANTLSILENNYVPPVLTQTIAMSTFDQAGYPEGFGSVTASYDNTFKNYRASDFTQLFKEPIPSEASFKIAMDIAPESIESNPDNRIFDIELENVGRISLITTGVEFLLKDGLLGDIERVLFTEPLTLQTFWNNGMMPSAKMMIEGDGKGLLTIKYAGLEITSVYDQTKVISKMSFAEATARGIQVKIDNISVIYKK